MDYARCNRCDAEVLVALCAHWKRQPEETERTPLAEITATYDHEAQCFLADARAFKKRLADACERLDVSGLGALKGDARLPWLVGTLVWPHRPRTFLAEWRRLETMADTTTAYCWI